MIERDYPEHFEDWERERQYEEMAVGQMMKPLKRRPSHKRDNYPGEELAAIERENVESSR